MIKKETKIMLFVNLQLFNNTNVTTSPALSAEMKTYYSKDLLDNAEPELVHRQFGQKRPLPKNNGKTIEFRSYSQLPKALAPLTEGVTPNGRSLEVKDITATIAQYGDYVEISDLLDLTGYDPNILEANKLLGSQAGRTLDTITRNEINAGTNVIYQPKEDGTVVVSRSGLDATCLLTIDTVFEAAAVLKAMNAPKIDGSYVAIIHPYVAKDFMIANREAGSWIDVNKYSNATKIFEGEIGKVGGVRFVESSEAKIWGEGESNVPEGLAVFSTLVFGAGAYGVTDLEGGGLEVFVKQLGSSGTADPLNQRATVGWKAATTTKILAEEFMVRIESTSSHSAKIKESN
jgi:N4-gp56 family major capsid protein